LPVLFRPTIRLRIPLLTLATLAYVSLPGPLSASTGAHPAPVVPATPTVAAVDLLVARESLSAPVARDGASRSDLRDRPAFSGDAREFYPTGPGDTWTYESSVRGRFANQVADSILDGKSVVFRIVSTDAAGQEQTLLVRQEGSRLYLGPNQGSLALISDFGLEAGASAPTRWGTQEAVLTIAGRHDALEVFGTRFNDVVEVHIVPANGGGLTYYFARGIGMVGMESNHPDARVRLVTATVNGRTIGAATD